MDAVPGGIEAVIAGRLHDDRAKTATAIRHGVGVNIVQKLAESAHKGIFAEQVLAGKEDRRAAPAVIDDVEIRLLPGHVQEGVKVAVDEAEHGRVEDVHPGDGGLVRHAHAAHAVPFRRDQPGNSGAMEIGGARHDGGIEEIRDLTRAVVIGIEIDMRRIDRAVIDPDRDTCAGILVPDGLDIAEEREMPLVCEKRVGRGGHFGNILLIWKSLLFRVGVWQGRVGVNGKDPALHATRARRPIAGETKAQTVTEYPARRVLKRDRTNPVGKKLHTDRAAPGHDTLYRLLGLRGLRHGSCGRQECQGHHGGKMTMAQHGIGVS